MNPLEAMLIQAVSQDSKKEKREPVTAESLVNAAALYAEKHTFKVGDIIQWKNGMKNVSYPKTDDPAIVLDVFDAPLDQPQVNSDNAHFLEKPDIAIGTFNDNGIFSVWTAFSGRFQPVQN